MAALIGKTPEEGVWRPHVTVAAVIARGDEFLLVEEIVHGRKVLNQPAGHLEPGESLQAAAVREALEETGLRVTLSAFLGTFQWRSPGGRDILRFAFAAECAGDAAARPLDPDILCTRWLDYPAIAAAGERLRSPLVLATIDAWRCGRRLPLDAIADLGVSA